MKLKHLFLLVLLPFLVIIVVNESSPKPSDGYKSEQCTRYCHSKYCSHLIQNKLTITLMAAYQANIHWLGHNPLGMSYREMNLLVYVLLYPTLILFLLWRLVNGIKK